MSEKKDILNNIPLTVYNRDKIRDICKKHKISLECFLGYVIEMYLQEYESEI